MVRYGVLFLAMFACGASYAGIDTAYLRAMYDRCLDFSEEKADSVNYYAEYISSKGRELKYENAAVLSLRLKGLSAELKTNYDQAINYYLQSLDEAERLSSPIYQMAALSDLAIVYSKMKRPQEAKEFYLRDVQLARQAQQPNSLATTYNNLAVIYTQLNELDSALVYLEEALSISKQAHPPIDASSTYNNLGNLYFKKQNYARAQSLFMHNYLQHMQDAGNSGVWVDHLNLADVYVELHKFDSAHWHLSRALDWALRLNSKDKEADTYGVLAKLYEREGKFEEAYSYLKKWYSLDTSIVNSETNRIVSELQERYYSREREAENKLLLERIQKQRYRNQSMTTIAVAFGLIAIVAAMAFATKRNANRKLTATNELVTDQNEKLAELNQEKDALIAIVSHDLSTPFSTIQVWTQVLQMHDAHLTTEQHKAIDRIMQAGKYGENLIRRILDVEKLQGDNHALQLETFDPGVLIEEVVESFRAVAAKKNIGIDVRANGRLQLVTDRQLLRRVCENLLSNAIKYSPSGKQVRVSASDDGEYVRIVVSDDGVGIASSELPRLFSKYGNLSSQPTGGEHSTGLGLSIVKRIVTELNGKITCETKPGAGSTFTVLLRR